MVVGSDKRHCRRHLLHHWKPGGWNLWSAHCCWLANYGPGVRHLPGAVCHLGNRVLVPGLALTWRRLHDTNRSGALYFLGLIPIVVPIILLVFVLIPQNPEGARFDK